MVQTVEAKVRAELARRLGGVRGALEIAAPLLVFAVAYAVSSDTRTAVIAALIAAVLAYGLRLLQRSTTTFVLQGLIGIGIAAVFVSITGEPEDAFLPGLMEYGVWALVLGISLVVRWPVAGFVIGAVLGDMTGWRNNPAMLKLADRLTVVLLAPMLLGLAVQIPLYLAGEVSWLAISRVALNWPLHAATLAVAGLILVRGKTPLPDDREPTPD